MRSIIASVLASTFILQPLSALAGDVTGDPNGGKNKPIVQSAPNGAAIVQIVAPSKAGVSTNKYNQFNVGPTGLIFNNSPYVVGTQLGGAFLADIRRRQQHAIHQGLQAIMFDYRGARDLLKKAGAKSASQGPAGMIRAERKQKCRIRPMALKHAHQIRHPFAGAAKCVNVDFENELWQRINPSRREPRRPGRDRHRKYCAACRPSRCLDASPDRRRYW